MLDSANFEAARPSSAAIEAAPGPLAAPPNGRHEWISARPIASGGSRRRRLKCADHLILRFDAGWRCDSDRQIYDRIIGELRYDADDVCEVRVSETAIEVDAIDFDDAAWPGITRRFLST